MLRALVLTACLLGNVLAQGSTFTPARPPSLPLAVSSPYLSTWQNAGSDGGNGGYLAGQWPSFWAGQITGWSGMIRVDEATYTWMGAPVINDTVPAVVNQTSYTYTATKSIFEMDVGGYVRMTITFLSNIEPNDCQRSSLPFSYMDVQVSSLDGSPHAVQVYTDISGEWVSGDDSALIQWDYDVISGAPAKVRRDAEPDVEFSEFEKRDSAGHHGKHSGDDGDDDGGRRHDYKRYGTKTAYEGWKDPEGYPHPRTDPVRTTPAVNPTPTSDPVVQATTSASQTQPLSFAQSGVAYHKVYRQTQLEFSEIEDQAEWGNWYYVTEQSDALTHESGADGDVRGQFVNAGFLSNAADPQFRAINDRYPVFAYSVDFGDVTTPQNYTWGISHAIVPAVQFEGADGNSTVNSLWTDYWGDELDAIAFFFNDYSVQSGQATNFDNRVIADSNGVSNTLGVLTQLAARQSFGALAWTGTQANPLVFIKEISSNGNTQTVDVIFPFHPIALYTNPQLLRFILDPLFINQEAGNWPFKFAIHDLGSRFPNVTGHGDGDAEQQPLEECGNMIQMALAYAQRANDDAYLSAHYDILLQWNDFLIDEALIPANQISTDDFAGALVNQTNLALKGIVGIEAMAQIATRTGNPEDAANFTAIAHDYITRWLDLGIAMDANPPHTTLSYGDNASFNLLYNLYPDRELNLNLVPQSVYDMQSAFYPTVFREYGVPLDTRHDYTKGDWEVWVAAIASVDTRNQFYDTLARWINVNPTNLPVTDLYDTGTGDYPTDAQFIARPVVGAWFAELIL
ncbi:MAG: hypothetical protein M1831_001248 [Alyxoria varia]|nr:MAG: hypothetical protein M1831_001248 [Alyxoria varia]